MVTGVYVSLVVPAAVPPAIVVRLAYVRWRKDVPMESSAQVKYMAVPFTLTVHPPEAAYILEAVIHIEPGRQVTLGILVHEVLPVDALQQP